MTAHETGLDLIGDVPPGWIVEAYPGGDAPFPSDPGEVVFWNVPPFGGPTVAMLDQLPAVRVIQLMSAGAERWVGKVRAGVTLCKGAELSRVRPVAGARTVGLRAHR